MPCPTCSGTLARLFCEDGRSWFHCARCGTIVVRLDGTDHRDVYAPSLVERVRRLVALVTADRDTHDGARALLTIFHTTGVLEAIHLPEERPQ